MATHEKLQYTVIHKILCQCRKANDNTELISIVTTNHYLGDFHQPRKVFKHFFFEKPNPLVLTGKE